MNPPRESVRAALAAVRRLAAAACRDVDAGRACFAGLAAALEAIRREAARAEAEALDDEAEPAA